jgi:cytoskeleton protein RodZ
MSADPASNPDETLLEPKEGPGRVLRVARQRRGLEIEDVAAALHLSPSVILALEHERYDDLPGAVFISGYLRNYARLLGIDAEALLDTFRAASPQAELPRPRTTRKIDEQVSSSHFAVRAVSLVILLALGAMVVLWWQNQRPDLEPLPESTEPSTEEMVSAPGGEETVSTDEPSQPVSQADPPPAPELPSPPTASRQAMEQAAEVLPTAEPAEPEASLTDGQEPAAAVEAVEEESQEADGEPADPGVAENGVEIVMEFSGPCWVDVRDKDGEYKLFGEMSKGDRHVLAGMPPYSMIIGNAAAVEILVAGKPFDLDPIARGNVARFTLDPAQLP